MKLDLETLKQVKFMFDIHSDHSTMCNGYRSLCATIEEAEKESSQTPQVTEEQIYQNLKFIFPIHVDFHCKEAAKKLYDFLKQQTR